MPSNALSSRRQPLRRPKVCYTAPNPGRCHEEPGPSPGPTITCSLTPAEFTQQVDDSIEISLFACNSALPDDEDVADSLSATGGDFSSVEAVTNCAGGSGDYESDTAGDFVLTAEFTFSDASICIATALAHIEEEEE